MVQITIEPGSKQFIGNDCEGQDYTELHPEENDPQNLIPYNLIIQDYETGATGDMDNFSNAIGGALDAVQTLDNLREALASDDGELNPAQTKLCQITMESIRRQMGLEHLPQISLESVGTRQVALEGLGSLLEAIWRAIFNTLKAIWEALKSLFGQGRKDRTAAAIKSIEKLNKDEKWFQPVVIENNNMLNAWWYIGTDITVGDLFKSIMNVDSFCDSFGRLIVTLEGVYADLPGEIKNITNNPEKIDDYLGKTKRLLRSYAMVVFGQKTSVRDFEESEDANVAQLEIHAARTLTSGRVPVALFTDSETSAYGFMMEGFHLKSQGTYETKHSMTIDNPHYFEMYMKHMHDSEDRVDKLMASFQKMMSTAVKQENVVMKSINRSDVTNNDEVIRANRALASSFRELTSIASKIQKFCLWVDNSLLEHSSFVDRASSLVVKNLNDSMLAERLRTQAA